MRLAFMLSIFMVLLSACTKLKPEPGDNLPPPPAEASWRIFNTSNSAIPDNQVNVICIDGRSTKWIGTSNGLAKVQDSVWSVYNESNSPLPSMYVTALTAQGDGKLWIGTNGGLASFDGRSWAVFTIQNSLLPENVIMSLACDTIRNIVWVGTSKGLISIDQDRWTLYDETDGLLLYSLCVDGVGALWAGAFDHFQFQGSLRRLYNGSWKTIRLESLGYTSAFPYAVTVTSDNKFYALLTGTAVSAVVSVDASGSLTELPKPPGVSGLRTMVPEKNRIWVGGNQLSAFGGVEMPVLKIPGVNNGMLCLDVDDKGRKWIGTTGAGLAVYTSPR